MKALFLWLGFKFLKWGGWDLEVLLLIASMPKVEIQLMRYARMVVEEINNNSNHGTSGEWKRHIAMGVLQNKFPNFSKRQIAMAIEIALG